MFGGMGNMGNMAGMMKKVQKMQSEMKKMQDELKRKTVDVTAGGGAVKVVMNKQHEAMYFSRSLIPYPRHPFHDGIQPYKHIGIYAYRRGFLLKYAAMEQTPAEEVESLEQLRVLENGYKIKVITTEQQFIGIDTPEDLEHIREYFAKESQS